MKEFMINDTPVKMWAQTCDAHAWKEVTNICSLPFVYHHVALMPDLHGGKGMPKLQRKFTILFSFTKFILYLKMSLNIFKRANTEIIRRPIIPYCLIATGVKNVIIRNQSNPDIPFVPHTVEYIFFITKDSSEIDRSIMTAIASSMSFKDDKQIRLDFAEDIFHSDKEIGYYFHRRRL